MKFSMSFIALITCLGLNSLQAVTVFYQDGSVDYTQEPRREKNPYFERRSREIEADLREGRRKMKELGSPGIQMHPDGFGGYEWNEGSTTQPERHSIRPDGLGGYYYK